MATEVMIVVTNVVLAHATYLAVPEEKHPHFVRKARFHVGRISRMVRPGRSHHIARHRAVSK